MIKTEEEFLHSKHGNVYKEYFKSVPRFFKIKKFLFK